jgi:hypothetical protein
LGAGACPAINASQAPIGLHPVPLPAKARLQDIELAGISQRISQPRLAHSKELSVSSAQVVERSADAQMGYSRSISFDHVVGAREQRCRHVNAKRLGSLESVTSSNFVGCSAGISAGLPPCRILITK